MEVQYDIEYLKEKDFFKDCISDEIEIDDEKMQFLADVENNVAYFELIDREKIRKIIKEVKRTRIYEYFWFYYNDGIIHKLLVHRRSGENKWFIYNPKRGGITETKKSKEDKWRGNAEIVNEFQPGSDKKGIAGKPVFGERCFRGVGFQLQKNTLFVRGENFFVELGLMGD